MRHKSPGSAPAKGKLKAKLRLYVAGRAPNSLAAYENLCAALSAFSEPRAELEVIDVLAQPERALADGVLVTPMLMLSEGDGERRMVGNLGGSIALRAFLGAPGGTT